MECGQQHFVGAFAGAAVSSLSRFSGAQAALSTPRIRNWYVFICLLNENYRSFCTKLFLFCYYLYEYCENIQQVNPFFFMLM